MRAPFDKRPSGIRSVGELPWGSHFCVFHASEQELLEALVPFVKAGLENNELCTWEIRAPLTADAARAALTRAVPDLVDRIERGQLELVDASDGAPRAPLESSADRAILSGLDGLRLVRDARGSGASARADAETIETLDVIAAFPYPRADLGVVELMERVQEHPFALIRNSGSWEVLRGSEARTTHDALRRSEDKLQSLFRNMSEGFAYHRVVLDGRGHPCDYIFLEVSPAFERLTGLCAQQVLGKRVTQVIPGIEADPADWIGTYGRVALTGVPIQFESHAVGLDRYFAVSAFSGRKGYFGAIFSDITAHKRAEAHRRAAEESLHEANLRLQEADRRKDEFLAVLSHELRNPLAPIRNSSYILRHAPLGSDQAWRAQAVIDRQTAHLARLVDDLLDVTRVAQGKIELRRARVDLRDVVWRAAEDFRFVMNDRGVKFHVTVPEVSTWSDVDGTRITQVIGNLLHNASKFTRNGDEVTLSLEENGLDAVIRVRDTGAGIDPELLPRVFDPFIQGERTLARTEGGLGLGLALVKGIAQMHGGTVCAESAGRGRGAELIVRLPLADVSPAQIDIPAAPLSSKRRRILVVDDNADAAESLADVVVMLGHAAEVAYDGPSAVEKARANPPDVVFCDIGLPGMSGYEVAKALRDDGSGMQLYALSGYAQSEDVKKAIEAGFDGHLAKPADIAQIERLLS
jgi:PAS domain S-box-containing protein